MAKFGEKIFEFREVLKSCRIPISCTAEQWFLNVGKNSVVNVHDLKTLHTWTLTHPHYFTSSVAYSNGNLYCVMDKNVLIKWSVEEDDLKNAHKIKFDDFIHDVIPVNEANPIIVFESGRYAIVTNTFYDIKPSDTVFLKENEELIWADACTSAAEIKVFCLTYNQKEQHRIIYTFTINKESYTASSFINCKIFHEKRSLRSWCLNYHESLFLSLWSDGKLFSHNIKESREMNLLNFKDIEKATIIDINCIDSNHIVVAKAISKKEECILQIWDIKCAILKAEKIVKAPSLDYVQIAALNSHIFLCFNKELVAITFQVDDPTFYAALGMSESNKYVQHSWSTTLDLAELPIDDELEIMDVCQDTSESVSVEFIANKLLNKKSPDLMCIPESELVKLLQLAIKHSKEKKSDSQCFDKNMYTLLNILFSSSFNDVLLLNSLKRMNLEETLVVLQWLLLFLSQTVNAPLDVLENPSDLQIVNWACLIFQSHMEALLFSKDKTVRKLLKQFQKEVLSKKEIYEDFECIQNYFSVIEKKNILPQKCTLGSYCLEHIEI